jgi:hypothetical protein
MERQRFAICAHRMYRLNANDEIPKYVWGKIEGDIVWDEPGEIIPANSKTPESPFRGYFAPAVYAHDRLGINLLAFRDATKLGFGSPKVLKFVGWTPRPNPPTKKSVVAIPTTT